MKKVFISQPMKDLSNERILQDRKVLIARATELYGEDIKILNSAVVDLPSGSNPLEYLAASLRIMANADVVIFHPGWAEARGCCIEHGCCVQYGIEHFVAFDAFRGGW